MKSHVTFAAVVACLIGATGDAGAGDPTVIQPIDFRVQVPAVLIVDGTMALQDETKTLGTEYVSFYVSPWPSGGNVWHNGHTYDVYSNGASWVNLHAAQPPQVPGADIATMGARPARQELALFGSGNGRHDYLDGFYRLIVNQLDSNTEMNSACNITGSITATSLKDGCTLNIFSHDGHFQIQPSAFFEAVAAADAGNYYARVVMTFAIYPIDELSASFP